MDQLVLGTPVVSWIGAAAVFVAVAFGVPLVRSRLRRLCDVSGTPEHSWRSLVMNANQKWMRTTTLVIAIVLAIVVTAPEPRISSVAKLALVVMLAVQVLRLVPVVVDWFVLRFARSQGDDSASGLSSTIAGLRWLVLAVAYALIILLVLQNLGVDVTSLIAGLGIGGIAVALALQNILGDLFASLTIALDKPFIVGDFIVVGSEMGTVEHVGLKTTRLRSLSGEQLVFGNADLLASRIRNYKRMSERRVVFGFGVVYGTPPEQIDRINAIVRSAIELVPHLRFDRCHLHRFGASSLDFEAVYYINSPDFNAHMDAQQAVYLSIAKSFRQERIEFAFPTQTIHLARERA